MVAEQTYGLCLHLEILPGRRLYNAQQLCLIYTLCNQCVMSNVFLLNLSRCQSRSRHGDGSGCIDGLAGAPCRSHTESKGNAAQYLNTLYTGLGIKRPLNGYGVQTSDIDRAVDIALSDPFRIPRKVGSDWIEEIIGRACVGRDDRLDI